MMTAKRDFCMQLRLHGSEDKYDIYHMTGTFQHSGVCLVLPVGKLTLQIGEKCAMGFVVL